MKNTVSFVKAVASGNDFIIVDRLKNKQSRLKINLSRLAKMLCQRKLSVGADGLLLIEPAEKADFKMRIFNPDGSEVDMCGNGSRCAALYVRQNRIVTNNKMDIETAAGNLQAEVKEDKVKIRMSGVKDLRLKFDLDIEGKTQNVNYINTGVPHVVCFVRELDNLNVEQMGKAIRYHPEFQPAGTNADFVEVLDKNHIRIRTYERGVEEETASCGTGAVAAAIVTTYEMEKKPKRQYKIKVDTSSGEPVAVYFNIEKNKINDVYLEGKAKVTYKAEAFISGG